MFRVKICGVRLNKDVQAVGDAGADAIGLNFFQPSIRSLPPFDEATRELSAFAQRLGLYRVGVFVNEPAEHVLRVAGFVGLDAIQLHGDESLSDVHALSDCGLDLLRAIKIPSGKQTVASISAASEAWAAAGFHLLFDADAGPMHGGGGRTLDWPSIRNWAEKNPSIPWTLAGGLTPENVAEAIAATSANSVDTASGVESPRGVKNADSIDSFVRNSRA
ncbi:MAG: phosphoribosylanthranilate isomerase [Planctomycetota bacterium]